MYIAACLLHDVNYEWVVNAEIFADRILTHEQHLPLRYLKKINLEAYAYAIKADELM